MTTASRKNNIAMKAWPTNHYDCNGDYRNEMHLESLIGGPLYDSQNDLPKLPIPSVKETIDRLLPTALPLAKTKQEEVELNVACKQFEKQSQQLHERLIHRRENEMNDSSFLQQWWNQLGYLQVRDPVVVNVSYFFSFVDDPTVDTSTQRAAAILFGTALYRKQVCSGNLAAGRVGRKNTLLCSTAYKYMFNACRIPLQGQDRYRIFDPSSKTHAVVARKGHFFSIEIVDRCGDPLPIAILESQLQQCIALADSIPNSRAKIGIMTSDNRDDWAAARAELLQLGGAEMKEALEILESGAIMLNLDDEAPVSRQECGSLFWTGGLTSGQNRYFDKSIQIMVANNGKAGLIAEHSMMDGMPVIGYADFVCKMSYARARIQSPTSSYKKVRPIDIFEKPLSEMDRKAVGKLESKAWSHFHKLITEHALHAQSFQGFGSSFIKKSGFPPDAFVQVAMQLATYRLFGEQVATYEATQVRPFLHGRTEVTRAVSPASEAFIKKLGLRPKFEEKDPNSAKLLLLKRAITAHVKYTGLAAKANGVDRHLFGLSMMLKDGETAPKIFSDPVFLRAKRWRCSTSQLSHPKFNLWGYGEVVPDGVGLAYSILPASCVFCITARRSTGWTDKLSELLEEALLEMRRIIEVGRISNSRL